MSSSLNKSSFVSAARVVGDIFLRKASVDYGWRLVVASVVPFVASALWHSSRTVIEVTDDEQSLWIQMWLSQQYNAIRRVRRLMLLSPAAKMGRQIMTDPWGRGNRQAKEEDDKEEGGRFAPPKLEFQPANGVSMWTWHGWWPISVSSLSGAGSDDKYYGGPMLRGARVGYTLTVWFAPFGTKVARELLLQGRQLWLAKRAKKTEIWLLGRRHIPVRFKVVTRPSRPLSSVIVEGNTKEALRQDAIRFLGGEQWYVGKGIPYRRGFLLYGSPGCGKTSLVTALAGDLRLPIVLVPLNDKDMDDSTLMEVLGEAPRDSIVLIEDIDCALPRAAEPSQKAAMLRMERMPVTLSGLLNAIDGVGAQEGRLLFMTTNHIDRLDEALIRPGRVDVQFHLGKATRAAAGELFDQFFASSAGIDFPAQVLKDARSAFLAKIVDGAHSFAALQGVLMTARDDPRLVEEGIQNLLETIDAGHPEKHSAWDALVSAERASKKALEKEKQDEESQRASCVAVVKRLAGSPTDVIHIAKKGQISFQAFSTFGVPDMFAASGVLYYEIEILKTHGCPQFGFAKQDGIEISNENGDDGVGDNENSWAVDGFRRLKWHDGEERKWNCTWKEGTVVGLAANVDAGMIAVSIDGVWNKEELGVVFHDKSIKEGVFPCFTASYYKVRYCFDKEHFKYGKPLDSIWKIFEED